MFSSCDTVLFIPTQRELKKLFPEAEIKTYQGFEWALVNNIPAIVTGIGKTNSAITACRFYSRYAPKTSVLTGICGAYRISDLNIGDTVTVIKDYFVDEASFDGNNLQSMEEKGMPLSDKDYIEFLPIKGFKKVLSNTVSLIPSCNRLSEIYQKKTNAYVENMEGASFGLAALSFGIKAYQLRAVSNFCGENPSWNIKKAIGNLREALFSL